MRFVAVDVRNFKGFSNALIGKCIVLFKKLKQKRRDLVLLCEPDIAEIFALLKVDRLIPVMHTEDQLEELVQSSADLPYIVSAAVP